MFRRRTTVGVLVPALMVAGLTLAAPVSAAPVSTKTTSATCTSAQGSTATVTHSVSIKAVKKKGYKHTYRAVPVLGSKVRSLSPLPLSNNVVRPANVATVLSVYGPANHTGPLRVFFVSPKVEAPTLGDLQWCDVHV